MSIGFVIGRAGTGKTRHCLDQIIQLLRSDPLGPPIFWIVPRQVTFSVERLLLEQFGPFSRCRILSFDKLGDEVLGTTGGAAVSPITSRGRQMILGLLLRQLQNRLSFFTSSARRLGLASELDHTFTEIERSGTELRSMVETLETALGTDPTDADTQTLLAKSRDLLLLYDEYQKFLGPDRLDPHRRLERVLEVMCDCPAFKNATVFIDAFTEFTRHERQMIVGLAGSCADVTVTMLIDPASPVAKNFHLSPDELSLFHKTERNFRQLMVQLTEAGATIRPIVRLESDSSGTGGPPVSAGKHGRAARATNAQTAGRFRTETLQAIEHFAFDHQPPQEFAAGDSIERIAAPDRASEVDAVARRIRDLLRTGSRLRDVIVLVRDLSKYQPLIATSFREHGLTYFIDARRSAMHHPLLQWLRAVFAIARKHWPTEDSIALLKSGLAGVSLDQADEIENYVLLHGITREKWESPEPWDMQRGSILVGENEEAIEQETAEPIKIDAARREVLEKIRPFLDVVNHQPRLTFKQICSALFNLMESFGVRATIAKWIEESQVTGKVVIAAEHEQTWTNLVELFDEMVDLLGDHEVKFEDYVQTCEAGLEKFDFALTPPTLDQVAVGEIERSRATDAKTTFVLGLAEGLFPMATREPTVLTDADRGLLRRRSIELDDDTTRALLDERLLGYLAFTRASERLILTRPSAEDGGRPLNASPFWQRLDLLFPTLAQATTNAPCYAHDKPDCIATPRQLVTGLMRWARQFDPSVAPDPAWSTLYDAVASGSEMGSGFGVQGSEKDGSSTQRDEMSLRPSPGTPGEGRVRVLPPAPKQSSIEEQPSSRESTRREIKTMAAPSDRTQAISSPVLTLIAQAWPALSYTNDATLSPAVAGALFPSPLEATVSRIETYATCPFKHFAQYGLQLKSREVRDFSFADAGMAYHQIMESIVGHLLQSKSQWKDLTDEQAKARIAATAAEVAKQLRNEVMLSSARNRYMLGRIERTLSQVIASQRTLAARQTLQPARTGVKFGRAGDKLQSPLIKTAAGREVRLQGRMDRVDQVPDRALFSIVDYKSGNASLSLQSVYHGLAMQLLAYMLVLRENQAGAKRLTPIGAFYQRVTRSLQNKEHPSDVPEPGSDEFHLLTKPRGIFQTDFVSHFDNQLAGGNSLALNVSINKDNTFGRRESSDVADAGEINQLLDYVKKKIGDLADDLMSGNVSVTPYRLGNVTPCPRCEFRSVCRFEVGINRYHKLEVMKRSAVMEAIGGGGGE